jgi:hypothetical protein
MHRMAPLRQGSPSTPSHRVHQKSHYGINPQSRMPQRVESDLKHQRCLGAAVAPKPATQTEPLQRPLAQAKQASGVTLT